MTFEKESLIRATPERVFAFHELPDALQRLTPPDEPVRIIQAAESLNVGAQTIIEFKILRLLPIRWVARHTVYDPPRMFEDVQVTGPFRRWRHQHFVIPSPNGAILRDQIEYEPPCGIPGRLLAPAIIVPRLRRLFDYRHEVTRAWCEATA
ncbi:MAG TPA: SRPBCC family protein [Pyrinomonadaceae bacterium]|nr:SRPBCC family protein [Pyrinomonadaceae bacterium]